MIKLILHSGGADGADTLFNNIGFELKVLDKAYHYYYKFKTPKGNTEISTEQYDEGVEKVIESNKTLHRVPNRYMHLLARNWFQVKNSDAVFAISHFQNDFIVDGGTGWAVQMAIDNDKPVHVFDQYLQEWYVYDKVSKSFKYEDIPLLTKNFAGIGTRELNEFGRNAIYDLYMNYIKNDPEYIKNNIVDYTDEFIY